MRGLNNRQTTIQRTRAVKRRQLAVMRKGAKRRDVSRRGVGK